MTSLPASAGQASRLRLDARSAPASWAALGVGAVAIATYFLLHGDAQTVWYEVIGAASVCALAVGTPAKCRARGSPGMVALHRRDARPGPRRRRVERLRDRPRQGAAGAVGGRRVLPGRLPAADRGCVPDPPAARRRDDAGHVARCRRRVPRRRARPVDLRHRPVQPRCVVQHGRAPDLHGVPGDGRAAAGRARPADRRARRRAPAPRCSSSRA